MAIAMPMQPNARPFTVADLAAMPDDGRRHELVDATLIVSAAPSRVHQRAVGRLYRLLDDACPPEFEVVIAPFDVVLDDDTSLQPDLLVARRADLTETNLPTAPLLAVEVMSRSSRMFDSHVKRERFERAGTAAFWVVDPSARPAEARLVAWELGVSGRYREVANVQGRGRYQAAIPYRVDVTPGELVA